MFITSLSLFYPGSAVLQVVPPAWVYKGSNSVTWVSLQKLKFELTVHEASLRIRTGG